MTTFDPDQALQKLNVSIPTPGLEAEGEKNKVDVEALAAQQGVLSTEVHTTTEEETIKNAVDEEILSIQLENKPRGMNAGPENLIAEAHVSLTNGITIRSLRVVRTDLGRNSFGIRVIYPLATNLQGQKVKLVSLPEYLTKAIEKAIHSELINS